MAAAAESLTPLAFELGGKSANIVFPDADLDLACAVAGLARLGHAQRTGLRAPHPPLRRTTTSTTRWWRASSATPSSARRRRPARPDAPRWARSSPRPPCDADPRRDRPRARAAAPGTLLTGGTRLGGALRDGLLHRAHGVRRRRPCERPRAQRDLRPRALDHPLPRRGRGRCDLRTTRSYGLAAYVYTRDVARAHRLARRLDVGSVTVNAFPVLGPDRAVRRREAERLRARGRTRRASRSSCAPRTCCSASDTSRTSDRDRAIA